MSEKLGDLYDHIHIQLLSLWYKWKYRNETKEQSNARWNQACEDLKLSMDAVRQELATEPASKDLYDVLRGLDDLEEIIVSR